LFFLAEMTSISTIPISSLLYGKVFFCLVSISLASMCARLGLSMNRKVIEMASIQVMEVSMCLAISAVMGGNFFGSRGVELLSIWTSSAEDECMLWRSCSTISSMSAAIPLAVCGHTGTPVGFGLYTVCIL